MNNQQIQMNPIIPQYPNVIQVPQPPNYQQLPLQQIQNISSNVLPSQLPLPPVIKIEIVSDVNSKLEWSSSICDCCLEPGMCLTGTLCPCILYGKNVENLTNKSCCLNACCCCILPCSVFLRTPYRRMIRNKWKLDSDPCNDCCVSLWCPLCALCQETREIRYRQDLDSKKQPNRQFMV